MRVFKSTFDHFYFMKSLPEVEFLGIPLPTISAVTLSFGVSGIFRFSDRSNERVLRALLHDHIERLLVNVPGRGILV